MFVAVVFQGVCCKIEALGLSKRWEMEGLQRVVGEERRKQTGTRQMSLKSEVALCGRVSG